MPKPSLVSPQVVPQMLIEETTLLWDYMGLTPEHQEKNARKQTDIVVGVIDSGICMKSKSFSDNGIRPLKEHKFPPSNDQTFKPNKLVFFP